MRVGGLERDEPSLMRVDALRHSFQLDLFGFGHEGAVASEVREGHPGEIPETVSGESTLEGRNTRRVYGRSSGRQIETGGSRPCRRTTGLSSVPQKRRELGSNARRANGPERGTALCIEVTLKVESQERQGHETRPQTGQRR
jgi:hypothetical protein